MIRYKVCWEIDIYANTPEEAAMEASKIMKDKDSVATYFEVWDVEKDIVKTIDLSEEE